MLLHEARACHSSAHPDHWHQLTSLQLQHADNMVSKLNSQKGATVGSVISDMGWYNLFTRGLPLRIAMVGTLTGLQWGIYDAVSALPWSACLACAQLQIVPALPDAAAACAWMSAGLPCSAGTG